MKFSEKLSKLLIINKNNFTSIEDIESYCGIGAKTLRKALNENREPSGSTIKRLLNGLGISPEDWESGNLKPIVSREKKGNSLDGKTTYPTREKYGSQKNEAERIETKTMYVPLVNQYAYAGYMAGFSDPEYLEELTKIPFEVDHEGRGNYVCFEMRGESMFDGTHNSLLPGDRLLSREIQPQHWQNKLHIRKYRFIIVHKTEGILVKEIVRHELAANKIIVHSLNQEYEDQEYDLADISQIFNVVKVQRNN